MKKRLLLTRVFLSRRHCPRAWCIPNGYSTTQASPIETSRIETQAFRNTVLTTLLQLPSNANFDENELTDIIVQLIKKHDFSMAHKLLVEVALGLPGYDFDKQLASFFLAELLAADPSNANPAVSFLEVLTSTFAGYRPTRFMMEQALARAVDCIDDDALDRLLRLPSDDYQPAGHDYEQFISLVYLKKQRWDRVVGALKRIVDLDSRPSSSVWLEVFEVSLQQSNLAPNDVFVSGRLSHGDDYRDFGALRALITKCRDAKIPIDKNAAEALETILSRFLAPDWFVTFLDELGPAWA